MPDLSFPRLLDGSEELPGELRNPAGRVGNDRPARADDGRPRAGLPSALLVAHQTPVWQVVKQYIEDQISDGTFAIGSSLPSVRQLSAEIGLNRNTVSKAYQALGRDGTVVSRRGVGVVVAQHPVEAGRQEERHPASPTDERLATSISTLVREAELLGVSAETLLERVAAEAALAAQSQRTRIAFIECSPADAESMSQHLSRHLDLQVEPLDLNDFLAEPLTYIRRYQILTTTFFHYQEVLGAVDEHDVEVVGLHHLPSHKSILELAQLPRGALIGLICTNERTVERLQLVIRTYTYCDVVASTVDDEAALDRVVREADVIVDTIQSHDVAVVRAGRLPIITMAFQSEPQSIEYLQERVQKLSSRRASVS